MRLIDADALKEMVDKINDTDYGSIFDYTAHREVRNVLRDIKHLIDNTPTIGAEPVRHGRWISVGLASLKCSKCKYVDDYKMYHKRCPKCAAKMDGGKNE